MKVSRLIVFVFLIACQSNQEFDNQNGNYEEVEIIDSVSIENKADENINNTLMVQGNSIVIFRPDSITFQSFIDKGELGIYEADADFGFYTNEAIELFVKKNEVNILYNELPYIKVIDCKNGPLVFPRDTILYGILLSATDKEIVIDTEIFPTEYYVDLFDKYFKE